MDQSGGESVKYYYKWVYELFCVGGTALKWLFYDKINV